MSEADSLKASIEYQKTLLILSITALFAIVGWIVGHLDRPMWLLTIALICAAFAAGFVYWIHRAIKRMIEELKHV